MFHPSQKYYGVLHPQLDAQVLKVLHFGCVVVIAPNDHQPSWFGGLEMRHGPQQPVYPFYRSQSADKERNRLTLGKS